MALVLAVIGFVVLGVIALLVAAYLLVAVGPVASAIAAVMALVPLAVVVWVIRWIDRWEPEPRAALLFALLWGAAASVGIALVFSFITQIVQAMSGVQQGLGTAFLSTVVQAPLVEEGAKGFGVLLLFWAFRRHFDGPVDGLVYGATIGIGFAFTENIQYFGLALVDSSAGGVGEIFFLRGILSPFAHVMFTACTGIVLGYASRRAGAGGAIGWFVVGLIPAIMLHALWNGAAFFVSDFYLYYAVVQVPLFLTGIAFVLFLRRDEQRVTRTRLAEYAAAGWFTPLEVGLVSTPGGRAAGRAWAARFGLEQAFTTFTRDATRLAFARQRVVSSRDRIGAQRAEADLLDALRHDRAALAAMPPFPMAPIG
jgi:RsiW-degrading membrane proteinase PrsW (M82 family)